jgi:hypothetical protein
VPVVVLLLAGVALFFAEMFRRGRLAERPRTFLQGGSVALELSPTPLRVALLWMLVPTLVYLALVPVATLGEISAGAWGDSLRGASADFWSLVFFYGFIAAGTVGVFLASLLKRASYPALASRDASRAGGRRRGAAFWRLVSTQWRLESWFAFTAAGLAGVLPFLWHDALAGSKPFDGSALVVFVCIIGGCAALTVVTVLNAWRSGDPYGLAESIA